MVNYVFTFIVGTLISVAFYGILICFYNQGMNYVDMFFHLQKRSIIPYFTVFLTGWSLAILLVKLCKLRNQRRVFQLNILPEDPNFVLSPRTAREMLDRIYLQVDQPDRYVLLHRINLALSNLQNLGNTNAVAECLNCQADNDEEYLANSYTILKAFIWAIPVLGFIGTVLGLAQAVGNFGQVITQTQNVEIWQAELTQVTGGLAIAFETTLIALVLALLVQLSAKFVLNEEELFLDECAVYCNSNIVAKMKNINLSGAENL